jgi:hypothetical protein
MCILGYLLVYPRRKVIEKREASQLSAVSVVVQLPIVKITEAVQKAFNQGSRLGMDVTNKFPQDSKFHYLYLYRMDDPAIDLQSQISSNNEESLRRYSTLDATLRKDDYYLYDPTGDYYWYSEYYWNGNPVKFRCGFIIHLEAQGNSSTKIEVLEYLPFVWAGEQFEIFGHSGPRFYHDIRSVQPTTRDRAEVLEVIKQNINK